MGDMEQRLTQVSQESSEKAEQLVSKKKFSEQVEELQQQVSTLETQRQREKEESSDQLKRLSASHSQTQQELQSKEKV